MKNPQLIKVLPKEIQALELIRELDWDKVQELRLRVGQPIRVICQQHELVLGARIPLTKAHIRECMEYISQYSLYAYESQLSQGYITIEGGHRVGVAGKAYVESEGVKYMSHITSINIRVAHQAIGCANGCMDQIRCQDTIHNTLIISPPRCGKTTLLRDIARQLSKGNREVKGVNVGIVDERSEIAACYEGVPQNDLGPRCDVLDACPKTEGIMMLIRSMSPRVIVVDEIGSANDARAIEYSITSGCSVVATVHGKDLAEIQAKPNLKDLLGPHGFTKYIILGQGCVAGQVMEIC